MKKRKRLSEPPLESNRRCDFLSVFITENIIDPTFFYIHIGQDEIIVLNLNILVYNTTYKACGWHYFILQTCSHTYIPHRNVSG